MTPSNWTAKIDSIILNYRHDAGQDMAMEIYDLDDDKENGNVDIYDYDSYREQITTLSGETTFNDIDITDVLRRDLFGEGAGDLTSGFLFLESGGAWHINHELPRISINLHTPTPPPTLPPTVTPTFTPTPEPWSGVRLFLSGDSFTSGDAFKLRALCRGEPGKTAADLYVILDVFGYYWFYPSWQQHPDCKQIPLEDGRSSYHFIMDFTWPDGDFGHVDGLVFWSAITEPTTFNIIGDYDHVEFGYY